MVDSYMASAVDHMRFERYMGVRLVLDPRRRSPCLSIDLADVLASDPHTDKLRLGREEIFGWVRPGMFEYLIAYSVLRKHSGYSSSYVTPR